MTGVQTCALPISALLTHIKAGRMRALATSGEKRLPALPQTPTLREAGVPVAVDYATVDGTARQARTMRRSPGR